jgi:hypothetical protein
MTETATSSFATNVLHAPASTAEIATRALLDETLANFQTAGDQAAALGQAQISEDGRSVVIQVAQPNNPRRVCLVVGEGPEGNPQLQLYSGDTTGGGDLVFTGGPVNPREWAYWLVPSSHCRAAGRQEFLSALVAEIKYSGLRPIA